MSIHFHPLKVKEVKKETNDCVTVEFEVPEELVNDFHFKQGQSLTMRAYLDGQEVRRTYSLCSSPLEKRWRVAIKKVDGGLFSSFANEQLKKGDVLDVMEPVGKFNTELDPSKKRNYLAFAAGSGITPVISIIKTVLAAEPLSSFTLVYGNRNRSSIIFFEELEGLKNLYMSRFNLLHILSRERTESGINWGHIDMEKLEDLKKMLRLPSFDEYFICGPEQMIFCIRDYLKGLNIDEKRIHFELFNSSTDRKQPVNVATGNTRPVSGVQSKITVKLDGRSFDFDLPLNTELPLLDAALQQGADLPYACKGGMCCTCKAKLVEGEVSMDVHWGLEEEEIQKGYILTCQSHPKTQRVIVDFDIK